VNDSRLMRRLREQQLAETFNSARETSSQELISVADVLWSQLDTPLSLGMSLLARNGQIEDVLRIDFDPGRYADRKLSNIFLKEVSLARDDLQAVSFLRKCPLDDVVSADARERTAWGKFLQAEEMCRLTNLRFRARKRGAISTPAVEAILHLAQLKIANVLGDLNAKSWALRCRFGPGADNLAKGGSTSPYHKLSSISSTEDFHEGGAKLALDHTPWARFLNGLTVDDHGPIGSVDIEVVSGNKVTFVPKTALTDRSIAIEPRLNIFAQLGLGALIRSRLRKAGLDLDTQDPSQDLAYRGSISGTVATLDLSMASDTLALELVRDLLPGRWFIAMDWCRSKSGTYRNGDRETIINYEKFSSMGNGFTFELETLILWALACACCDYCRDDRSVIRVFGDDIAYPVRSVDLLVETLGYCGFLINPRKSFTSGVFRESCGADFFNGVNVRPFLQEELLNHVQSLFRLANGLRRVAYRRNNGFGCDSRLKRVWTEVRLRIPPSLIHVRGPGRVLVGRSWSDVECDDGYLLSDLDEGMTSRWVRRASGGLEGWVFVRFEAQGRAEVAREAELVYIYSLYSSRDGVFSDHKTDRLGFPLVPLRGESRRRRLNSRAFYREWPNLGGWY